LAGRILPELEDEQPVSGHDASTNGLINQYKVWRGERGKGKDERGKMKGERGKMKGER
jgi:hypothetical protein